MIRTSNEPSPGPGPGGGPGTAGGPGRPAARGAGIRLAPTRLRPTRLLPSGLLPGLLAAALIAAAGCSDDDGGGPASAADPLAACATLAAADQCFQDGFGTCVTDEACAERLGADEALCIAGVDPADGAALGACLSFGCGGTSPTDACTSS